MKTFLSQKQDRKLSREEIKYIRNLRWREIFKSDFFIKRLESVIYGIRDGRSISYDEFLKLNFNYPSFEEQTQIGNFFKQLDDTIALHQRELEKFKILKTSYLEHIFLGKVSLFTAKNTITWEQRKLGEFGISTSGTSLENEFLDSGKYKVISIGSYSENSIYTDQGIRVNKTNKTESKILRKNDLTMILNDKTASGNIIGRVLLIDADESYVYNQRTQRIETDQSKFVPEFLYQLLNANNIRKKIILAAQGNTQIYVNWSSIRNISYLVPKSKEEQIEYMYKNFGQSLTKFLDDKSITPKNIAEKENASGHFTDAGTKWSFFDYIAKEYGVKSTGVPLNKESMKSVLSKET